MDVLNQAAMDSAERDAPPPVVPGYDIQLVKGRQHQGPCTPRRVGVSWAESHYLLGFSAAGAWLATVDAASWLLLVLLVLLMVRRWCRAGEGNLPTAADRLRFSTQSFDARPRQAVKIVLISLSSALIARGIYRDTASRGLNAALLAVLILSLLFNCLDVYSAWSRSIPLVFLVGARCTSHDGLVL